MIRQKKTQNKNHWHYTDKPGGALRGEREAQVYHYSRCRCFPTIVQHNLLPPSAPTISRFVADLGTAMLGRFIALDLSFLLTVL
jgi:hypothetical protein